MKSENPFCSTAPGNRQDQNAPALQGNGPEGEITILIVDDHAIIRENWRYILDRDPRFHVVAECGSAEESLELIQRLKPNVVMMDINLPGMNGLQATEKLRKLAPAVRVIGISLHSQPVFARKMMENGALSYVTKTACREELFQAILDSHQGKSYVCEEVRANWSSQVMAQNNTVHLPPAYLRDTLRSMLR